MNAFENHFASKAAITDEINISLGPAGELRYPSYNSSDQGCGYATRGCFQAYSRPARQDFRRYALCKYHDLSGVNKAWGIELTDESQIGPPDDGTIGDGRAQYFVSSGDYKNIQYGRDFIDWYNKALVKHGRRMLNYGIEAFNGAFASKKIGMKMAGVHWMMMENAPQPRIAEMAAGLIQSSVNFEDRADGYGYKNVMDMVSSFKEERHIVFYFTCLEKDNKEWDGGYHAYSLAKNLVFFVAQTAQDRGVIIKGENALSSGVENDEGWNNIENAFNYAAYSGFNVLRIGNVANNCTGKKRYQSFINRYKK